MNNKQDDLIIPLSEDKLMEKLADLEHDQWSHWTRHMLDNLTDENIARWRRQIDTPYSELSEKEKDSDREWAKKIIGVINQYQKELIKTLIEMDNNNLIVVLPEDLKYLDTNALLL